MPSIEKKWDRGADFRCPVCSRSIRPDCSNDGHGHRSERHNCSGRDGCDTERGDWIYDRDGHE